jgi:5-methylcytosine-specific restriction endonuclease McrA
MAFLRRDKKRHSERYYFDGDATKEQASSQDLLSMRSEPSSDFFLQEQTAGRRSSGQVREMYGVSSEDWDRKYNRTAKARATARRYYYSEKGQAKKIAYRQSYEMTEEQREKYRVANRYHAKEAKYKARTVRYYETAKGKAMKARKDNRYRLTEKGRFSKSKVEIKRKHQIKAEHCTLTRSEWIEIKEAFRNQCCYCGKELQRLEMDHVIPLSKGGRHTKSNVVPSCRTCNAKKGNRLLPCVPPTLYGSYNN